MGPAENQEPCGAAHPTRHWPLSLPGPLLARPQQSWLPARPSPSGALARLRVCPSSLVAEHISPLCLGDRRPELLAGHGERPFIVGQGIRLWEDRAATGPGVGSPPRLLIPVYTHRLTAWDMSGLNDGILLKYQSRQVRIIYELGVTEKNQTGVSIPF